MAAEIGAGGVALFSFLAGYLLILLAPGPNMIAVGCIAALHGLRGVLPMILGVSTGAAVLASVLLLLLGDVTRIAAAAQWMRLGGGTLLLAVAAGILRAPLLPAQAAERAARAPRAPETSGFLAGFATAASNPLTATYFAAALVPLAQHAAPGAAPAAGVPPAVVVALVLATAVGFWLVLAVLLARPAIRGFVQARQRVIRAGAALAIAGMALPMLWPGLEAARGLLQTAATMTAR